MTADTGREAVYAAEIAAFEGTTYESIATFDRIAATTRSVTTAEWWPRGEIAVRPARSDASSSTTRQRGADAPVIRLAAPQMTPATLVHELAHVLAGVSAGHGAVFRRAHLDLCSAVFGDEPAAWLADAYRSASLEVGARTWPAPPAPPARATARQPVAL